MTVPFTNIPANWRLPLHWVEVDPSKAGYPVARMPALLVGTRLGGLATSNIILAVSSADAAASYWGIGSEIERMVSKFLENNPGQMLYAAGVAEPVAGVTATGTITVSSAPTSAGTLNLYIAGQRIQVAVSASDTATGVATKIYNAIVAETRLPVTATSASAVVTLTAKWKGATGNDVKVSDSVRGLDGGESLPTGLTLAYVAMSGGTSSPDLSGVIAGMGDEEYKYTACPFTDSTSLDLLAVEYGFGDTGRWGYLRELYGAVYTAIRGDYATLATAGAARNDPVITRIAVEPNAQSPVWEVAAAYAAQAAKGLTNDPARPLQTLAFAGISPAMRGSRFTKTQINNLAGLGLATQQVNPDGKMAIVRETTSYQKNAYNVADDAYTDLTTLYTLSTLFERQKQAITSKFPRHKLADDGTRFGVGSAIVTPKIIKGELIAQYAQDEFEGLVENSRAFAANLIVERDPANPNRLNILYPPDLVNQLRVFAVLAQLRLQYSRQSLAA